MCFGICLANNCMLPIIPTDIFPRDLSGIVKKNYKIVKTTFDLTCLTTTVVLSLAILHGFYGIGIGTVFCAFLTGKTVSAIQSFLGKHVEFYRATGKKRVALEKNMSHAYKKKDFNFDTYQIGYIKTEISFGFCSQSYFLNFSCRIDKPFSHPVY